MIRVCSILSAFSVLYSSIDAGPVDDFQCQIPTCREFFFGLKNYPRRNEYEKICFETVYALQIIPRNHGKCINEQTGKLNPPCIYALANTIKKCIHQLDDVTEKEARYYCGYTVMKHCAVHLGLEGFPLKFNA